MSDALNLPPLQLRRQWRVQQREDAAQSGTRVGYGRPEPLTNGLQTLKRGFVF
jgi:hypothetical protein